LSAPAEPVSRIAPSRFVRPELAALITGYSLRAIERKIDDGVWLEGEVWIKAPDGRRLIDMRGYERWCLGASQ
jgi:hypothetical protein